ncbi:MAG: alpha-E domain-containing protein [Myxococcota bacterium]
MISRVAENCFWMQRYMERAESTARLLRVTRAFLLDVQLPELDRWQPLVVVTGERERFPVHFPEEKANDAEVVQRYLTWDERCPVSIRSSVYWARENARTIREVISIELWETINSLWHWVRGGQGRRLYAQDRDAFYRRIKETSALFQGVCQSTMLQEEPYDFMCLGLLLERASQTARMLDVKYHLLGPTTDARPETPMESAQWTALLRCCSGEHSYYRRHRTRLTGPKVATFLLADPSFPRSVAHCLDRSWGFLQRIEAATERSGLPSATLLSSLSRRVRETPPETIVARGLHAELTHIIDTTARVCEAVHGDYLDPVLEG